MTTREQFHADMQAARRRKRTDRIVFWTPPLLALIAWAAVVVTVGEIRGWW